MPGGDVLVELDDDVRLTGPSVHIADVEWADVEWH